MATAKFLPFITDKSSPLHLFDTLLARSSGISRVTLCSLFYVILKEGIKDVRAKAKELAETTSDTASVYEGIVDYFDTYRISGKKIDLFTSMATELSLEERGDWPKELLKFGLEDSMAFLLVMSLAERTEEVTKLPIQDLLNYEEILNDLPSYIDLKPDGARVTVADARDLRKFILYEAVFHKKERSFFVVWEPNEDSETEIPF